MATAEGFDRYWSWVGQNFNVQHTDGEDEPGRWHCNRCDDHVWYFTKHARNAHGDRIALEPLKMYHDDSDDRGRRDPDKPKKYRITQPERWPDSVDKCPSCDEPSIDTTFTQDSTKWRCNRCGNHGSVVASQCCSTCDQDTAHVLESAYPA